MIPLSRKGFRPQESASAIAGFLNSEINLPVYTHQRVDADAAFSVAAWAYLRGVRVRDLDLHFVSSESEIPEGVVALDVLKGIKGSDSCCFATLLPFFGEETNYNLTTLATYLTKVDNHQKYEEGLPPGVFYLLPAHILVGLKMQGLPDKQLCEWAELTLLALIAQGERTAKSYNYELPMGTERLSGGKVIILPPQTPQYASSTAFRQGAEVVIYQDGNNLGAIRETSSSLDLGEIYRMLPEGFYLDGRGFLLAWGTKKFPKQTKSPVTAKELAQMAVKLLEKRSSTR